MNYGKSQLGFTVIEVLVVIGIFAILAALGLFFSMDFYKTYSYNSEQVNVASVLSKARARSLANVNESWHGVRITGNKLTLFQGSNPVKSWANRNTAKDEDVPASSGLSISDQDVIFDQLSGNTGCPPADCVITVSGLGQSKTIKVTSQGAIIW